MHASDIYQSLEFPKAPADRPYTFIDMVSTIDGKILSGDRTDHVVDLGSKLDHELMTRIAARADAVLMGASTLRTTLESYDPRSRIRVVVTRSGDLPYESRFFRTGEAWVATPETTDWTPRDGVRHVAAGHDRVDFRSLLSQLRVAGVEHLLVLGGSEINAQLLHEDLIDELFLTIAPKVKLGRDVPTYADGVALPRESLLRYRIVESHVVNSEIFLRYRREHEG